MVLGSTTFADDFGDTTSAGGHIRFTVLPSGIVIGDALEDSFFTFNPHRNIASDGSIATVENNRTVNIYHLSGRSSVSSFLP